ncbi:10667_t:CDS:2 [Funneliformis caledonium]|uniref:10667_t:CDS:1 n=1 Tax=Funneliformis caledonium TaxID=1117310 RepID=A0A9N9CBR5_9GLOM|nr:10667_t:CDS:2 [Funneliformis caledonium]
MEKNLLESLNNFIDKKNSKKNLSDNIIIPRVKDEDIVYHLTFLSISFKSIFQGSLTNTGVQLYNSDNKRLILCSQNF